LWTDMITHSAVCSEVVLQCDTMYILPLDTDLCGTSTSTSTRVGMMGIGEGKTESVMSQDALTLLGQVTTGMRKCGVKVKRRELSTHKLDHCEYRMVFCEYNIFGNPSCSLAMTYGNYQKHLTDNARLHTDLVMWRHRDDMMMLEMEQQSRDKLDRRLKKRTLEVAKLTTALGTLKRRFGSITEQVKIIVASPLVPDTFDKRIVILDKFLFSFRDEYWYLTLSYENGVKWPAMSACLEHPTSYANDDIGIFLSNTDDQFDTTYTGYVPSVEPFPNIAMRTFSICTWNICTHGSIAKIDATTGATTYQLMIKITIGNNKPILADQ
jgi:hypothetical protein